MSVSALREDGVYLEETPKLTEWPNEPTVRDLKKDFEEAQSAHSAHVADVERWLDNLYIRGKAKIEKVKGKSSIVPKLIRKQAEWRYASLSEPFLSQPDLFKASPKTFQDKQAAIQNGLVLNHQFNTQIDKVKFIDEYVRTAVDEGTVIVRIGWEYDEGTETDQPELQVCDYRNVVIDPTAKGDLKKANFVIYSFETSISALTKAGKYQNLDQIDLEQDSILATPDHDRGELETFRFQDKARKRIIAYEYWGFWDIENNERTEPFVATWIGNTMIRMERNPFPDRGLPFVAVQYLPVRNSNYGEPDGELLEDNQKVVGAVTRGMIDIMGRSAAGQKGMREDALDVTNRRKFEMGEDYIFRATVDPRQGFYEHSFPEIPNSAQFMLQLQNMEAESLTGVKAFHGGISGDSLGSTATGASRALDASAKRELGILRRLAKGIIEIGYKIMMMNGEFLPDETIIRITDEEYVAINRDNLAGRFDLALDISSAEMDNVKAQELAFMLQTVGNSMPLQMTQIILSDIARLRKMFDLAKIIEAYQPQPNPIQQQTAMLEIEKLKAEIEKLKAEAKDSTGEGMLGMAKTQTELAKARHLGAQADMLDLNFVEQESGVTQERQRQLQGEQARANLQMKEREALMKDRNTLLGALVKPPTASSKT